MIDDGSVGRVLWINGSFSAGKTTVAKLLVDRLENAFLLDPELIGVALRELVPPSVHPGDFQDLRLWRTFTREAVGDAAERFGGDVIVPMTIARVDCFEEVIAPLAKRVRLDHFTLMATRETILARESARPDETGEWARKMIDRVLPALADKRFAKHIDAETQTAPEVAAEILRHIAA